MITFSQVDVAVYYELRVAGLRRRGKRWRGPCPIHHSKHQSSSVDPETGLWRCWSDCASGGDIIALEMVLTGASWRDAVMEVERIFGRVLLSWPASVAERRALAERRERGRGEMREARFFRIAIASIAQQMLDELPEAEPERFGPTQLLLRLRLADGIALRALYRDYLAREPRLAEALVFAGDRAWQRLCARLAHFVAIDAEVPIVA